MTAPVREFVETYDTPVRIVVTGDTIRSEQSIAVDDGLVHLPYWLYLLLC